MILSRTKKATRGESHGSITVSKPTDRVGRERLNYFTNQIALAHQAIEDLENRVARFGAIMTEADAAERALQDAVHADGGVALADYSAGRSQPGDAIVGLVAHNKRSSEAAAAAKTAKPHTEALLENAKAQLVALGEQKNTEVNRVLATLADADAQAYQSAFDKVAILHDKLCGYAAIAQSNIGDVRLRVEALRIPRFALPSLGNSDADPYIRARESELTIADSSRRWAAIKAALEADGNADISDLT
jgi:hypothetical protein